MSGHTKQQGLGNGTRYDKGSGDWLENERKKGQATGVFLNYGKRFCETCKQPKPKDGTPAKKGWKCKDCRKAAPNAKLTGDPQLHRGASSEQSERG